MLVEVKLTATVQVPDWMQGSENAVEKHIMELFPAEWYDFGYTTAAHCKMEKLTAVTKLRADKGLARHSEGTTK